MGDFDGTTNRTSPMTVVCATMARGFRRPPIIVSLTFFCGYHLVNDDNKGGLAMIRSLLAQLLRQFPYSSITPLPDISTHDIEAGDIVKLCKLFNHVVRQLQQGTPVFCFIDGINEYEREEYVHTMDKVVVSLKDLVQYGSAANFKLLLTSPRPTMLVKNAFDTYNETLMHMQRLTVVKDGVRLDVLQARLMAGFENGMVARSGGV
ncbi:hypothetical protein CC86DRAFT_51818 [Ophiobolus disseminans]|uniref:Nephrocystin 3-like N-terminal domain-containing protein n=1 Tax=Ophiobolus disseminans TaxID=1469910 RepID=A0A6A6ZUS3_9PLEO|nr:hypothetical protein CC86DRAFT_51818 [Ophiobolus disseminans]